MKARACNFQKPDANDVFDIDLPCALVPWGQLDDQGGVANRSRSLSVATTACGALLGSTYRGENVFQTGCSAEAGKGLDTHPRA
jgi:hypothetical protein